MTSPHLALPPAPPAWRQCTRFLLIALVLHALVLLCPAPGRSDGSESRPPEPIAVRLIDSPPAAPTVPPQAAPSAATPGPRRERPAPTPRPVIAVAPEPASPPASFSMPLPAVAPAATPAPPTAGPSPAAPATVTAARFDAAYLRNPRPNYPSLSRRLGEEGRVLLRVRVSPAGLASSVEIEKSSTFERLDEAARQVVARWQFIPARRGDEAIETVVVVPIVFRLDE